MIMAIQHYRQMDRQTDNVGIVIPHSAVTASCNKNRVVP